MNFTLKWLSPLVLKPHEDIIDRIVRANISKVNQYCKMSPIIVDSNSLTILDGHHRHYASLIIGLSKIPVILVDYNSNDVVVDSWSLDLREVKTEIIMELFRHLNSKGGKYCIKIGSVELYCDDDIFTLYWRVENIRQKIMSMGYNVVKIADKKGLVLPPIQKQDITLVSSKGLRFPPKSTRHIYKFFIPRDELSLKC
ncbi:hypothetical protein KN1_25960 [Stygiolobus caldivivus]|uniref:ParB-like N-terminal domain-containing protein n=2 Tax=Stygiolobus caldivivus TaxID=2824673 RepID=A0A8D5U8E9_9CREN|nr:hypothetical protein KN1_25960 [Stygiolobus caldivivus]